MEEKVVVAKDPKVNVNQPQSPPVPPPEKRTPRSPLLWFGIGLLVVVLGGGYYLLSSKIKPASQPMSTNLTNNASLITSPIPSAFTLFQDMLAENCEGSSPALIHIEQIPVVVDSGVVQIKLRYENRILCFPGSSYLYPKRQGNYLQIDFDEGRTLRESPVFEKLYVHDGIFVDEGHGGYPFMQPFGEIVDSHGEVKISAFLSTGERGTIVGESPVILRGIKTLSLPDGEKFYVTTDRVAIERTDPRLTQLLTNYSEDCAEVVQAELCVSKYEVAQRAVVNRFFSDTSRLEKPERGSFNRLKQILQAITAKL